MVYIVFNSLFLLGYLLSAAVQYNDPDPWGWIALYLAAAWMCVAWFRRRLRRWFAPVLLVISLVWIGTLLPSVVGKVTLPELFDSLSMKTRSIEEAREIGGLLLVAIWSAVLVHRKSM